MTTFKQKREFMEEAIDLNGLFGEKVGVSNLFTVHFMCFVFHTSKTITITLKFEDSEEQCNVFKSICKDYGYTVEENCIDYGNDSTDAWKFIQGIKYQITASKILLHPVYHLDFAKYFREFINSQEIFNKSREIMDEFMKKGVDSVIYHTKGELK